MQLETERLLLRSLQSTDILTLAALWSDSEVTRFMGGPRDYQSILNILQEDLDQNPALLYDLWPVVEKISGMVIGHCGIIDKEVDGRKEFDLTYVFTRSALGKGYATEIASGLKDYAFEHLNLKRIIALIDPLNTASSNVARKVGLRYEKDTLRPGDKMMQIFGLNR